MMLTKALSIAFAVIVAYAGCKAVDIIADRMDHPEDVTILNDK